MVGGDLGMTGRGGGVMVEVVQRPPERVENEQEDRERMEEYYASISASASSSLLSTHEPLLRTVEHLKRRHKERIERIESMPRRTVDTMWWPFVQHGPYQHLRSDSISKSR